jgi:hypothetical protein
VKKVFLAADFFVRASRKILVRVGNTGVVSNEVIIRRVFKKVQMATPRVIYGELETPHIADAEGGYSLYHRCVGSRRLPISPVRGAYNRRHFSLVC